MVTRPGRVADIMLAQDLVRLLTGARGGEPPRRACLGPDGQLCEKCAPADAEVEVLSRVCELARRAAGLTVWPRDPVELVGLAAQTNAAGAWAAVFEDLRSEAVEADAVARLLADSAPPDVLVRDLLESGTAAQLQHVTQILACLLPRAPPAGDYAQLVGERLGQRLPELVRAFVRLCPRRDVRDVSLTGLGKLLDVSRVPGVVVSDELLRAVDAGADHVARLFVHAPLDAAARPQLPAAVLARALRAPPTARYAWLAILTRLARGGAALDGDVVADLVAGTLAGCMAVKTVDPRLALAASLLAQAAPPTGAAPAARLAVQLAETLELACATVIGAVS